TRVGTGGPRPVKPSVQPSPRHGARGWVLGAALLAVLAGCNSIRVRRAQSVDLFGAWHLSAFTPCELSARTRQTLRRQGLEYLYARSPDQALVRLHAAALRD